MFTIFIIGTAGSGKSTFTSEFSDYLGSLDIYNIKVNLDPAVENLPYRPDVDVREYITAREVMEKYSLGPNGAIIASVDMMIEYLRQLKEDIISYKPGYILVDTPGQLELFVFREIGKEIVKYLASPKSALIFMIDTVLSLSPEAFLSSILLALSTFYRFNIPFLVALNKIDMVDEEHVNRVLEWVTNPETLLEDLTKIGYLQTFHRSLVISALDFIGELKLVAISALRRNGFEEVYTSLQQIYTGGEDYLTYPP